MSQGEKLKTYSCLIILEFCKFRVQESIIIKSTNLRIVAISDTHGQHQSLTLPKGDLLIHAGDISGLGRPGEIKTFLDWFAAQDFTYKVFIAGNHDFFFETAAKEAVEEIIPSGVDYLYDSSIEIEDLKIWGSPITPWFDDWAFNRTRGRDISKHWELIPSDVDLLITHGPPLGILDETMHGECVGCEDLLEKINTVKPKYHIFGHIHEGYGSISKNGTHFINASILDAGYVIRNKPVVLDV